MIDQFGTMSDTASAPARAPFAVEPHDSQPLPRVPKGLYIGNGGTVVLRGVDGMADVAYVNLPDASYIAVRARFVRASGTTASAIVAEA